MRSRSAMRFLVVGLLACLFGVGYFTWSFYRVTDDQRPFERNAWLAAPQLDPSNDPGCFRGGMAVDLVNSGALLGKSAAQAETTLGPPDHRAINAWRYAVGQCTGFGWHNTDLWLLFGADHLVYRVVVKHTDGNAP